MIRDGKVLANHRKACLPNYRVFDEKRYFTPGTEPTILDINGVRAGVLVCEDAWDSAPARQAREKGAQVLLIINASPYEVDKQRVLTTIDDGDGILRCHLAMLDDQPGQLLDPTKLGQLFRFAPLDAATQQSFLAVRAVRDKAFHGAWQALPAPWARYTHLTMKVIFLLCSIV